MYSASGAWPCQKSQFEAAGTGLDCERPAAQTGGQPDGDLLELADATVADQFAGHPETLAAALLGAGLQDDLVVAHGFDDVFALVDGESERLFGIDVLLRLGGGDVDQAVPVVRGAVDDDVDVVALQQLAEIGECVGHLAILGEGLDGAVEVLWSTSQTATMSPKRRAFLASPAAHAAAADQGDGRAVVGRSDRFCGFLRRVPVRVRQTRAAVRWRRRWRSNGG